MAIKLKAVETVAQSNLTCCEQERVVNPWQQYRPCICERERFKETDLVYDMEALIAALSTAKSADDIETALSSSNVKDRKSVV